MSINQRELQKFLRDFGVLGNSNQPVSLAHQVTKTLTNAQIKTLPTSPISLVPAPGANRLLIYVDGLSQMVAVDAYTNITVGGYGGIGFGVDEVYLSSVFANDEVDAELANFLTDGFNLLPRLTQTSHSWFNKTINLGNTNVNEPFLLWVNNAAGDPTPDFTGGHVANSLHITLEFRVYDLALKRLLTVAESGWNQGMNVFD
jgi:hypothetical protein